MSRQIIAVTGADARGFLQGLVTNDIEQAVKDGIIWAAMLTPQGKYLSDFFILSRPDGFWLDVDAGQAATLVQRLGMYKLRSKVDLAEVDVPVTLGTGPTPEGALPDPRHPAMGWRLYGAEGSGEAGDQLSEAERDAIRVEHVIPETGIELIPNDSFILEVGFERLHGVHFHKGCYVGQEVTSRMKHKATLRKGLIQVAVEGSAPVGTPILTENGREAGTLYTQAGGHGLAHMRFDRIGPGLTAGDAKVTASPPGE